MYENNAKPLEKIRPETRPLKKKQLKEPMLTKTIPRNSYMY